MSQSKTQSFIESLLNIGVGYVIAVSAQMIIFPLFGMIVPLADNLLIGLMFTVVSLVRSYYLRRLINKLSVRGVWK